MRDPFVFDLSRLRIRSMPDIGGRQWVKWLYLLPAGATLELDFYSPKAGLAGYISGGGGGGFHNPKSRYPFGLPEDLQPMFDGFQEHVAGLSAHQRLAWMAAAQKEEADA